MRQIKFRAWDKADVNVYSGQTDNKRMSFYGHDFTMDDDQNTLCFITPKGSQPPYGDYNSMERYELMQYTGLKDKNGKEIYESDILQGYNNDNSKYKPREVKWEEFEDAEYGGSDGFGWHIGKDEIVEIIGNVWENPELIENKI